jgi:hypothetical protein
MQILRRNEFNDKDNAGENNVDRQFWKEKFPAADGKAWHVLVMGLFFSFSGWGGRDFLFFTPFFPICSPEFPKASPDVPSNA